MLFVSQRGGEGGGVNGGGGGGGRVLCMFSRLFFSLLKKGCIYFDYDLIEYQYVTYLEIM